jgi:hypothetical protein
MYGQFTIFPTTPTVRRIKLGRVPRIGIHAGRLQSAHIVTEVLDG